MEVIGSNPIAPTIFKNLQAFQIWIWAIWGHFSKLLDDASLRFAFRWGHSLNVRVQSH